MTLRLFDETEVRIRDEEVSAIDRAWILQWVEQDEEVELLERFTELLPQIEATFPRDEMRIFMGGTSGSAWRAYYYSAQLDRPWAGILAAGG